MTGYITVNPVFSNFTFALLEDSGYDSYRSGVLTS